MPNTPNYIKPTICCVIVTYKPDLNILLQVMQAVITQVHHVMIVHNDSDAAVLQGLYQDALEIIIAGENLGIGAAQNIGIIAAKQQGFSHILLLDQDSIPHKFMVKNLMQALVELELQYVKPAAVGPRIIDPRIGFDQPFMCFKPYIAEKRYCREQSGYIPTDFLIASGMLIPIHIFDQAGLMNESFFIDNVDMEWCFRVASKGFTLYGVCPAILNHVIGDRVIRLWRSKELTINIYRHTSLRQYYIMRNRILLYLKCYTPKRWILRDLVRLLGKTAFIVAFSDNKAEYLKMIFTGLVHGLRGKTGKYPL